MTPLGGDARKLVSGFLQTSPQAPSPWLILLWVFFDVINPECDYRPSPVSPSETLNLGDGLGDLDSQSCYNKL